jgi:hypothetical protein
LLPNKATGLQPVYPIPKYGKKPDWTDMDWFFAVFFVLGHLWTSPRPVLDRTTVATSYSMYQLQNEPKIKQFGQELTKL